VNEPCPVCESELATVVISSPDGKVVVGRKCAALLEKLSALRGVATIRRPVLRVVDGSVS
jgi:hypothetical protein